MTRDLTLSAFHIHAADSHAALIFCRATGDIAFLRRALRDDLRLLVAHCLFPYVFRLTVAAMLRRVTLRIGRPTKLTFVLSHLLLNLFPEPAAEPFDEFHCPLLSFLRLAMRCNISHEASHEPIRFFVQKIFHTGFVGRGVKSTPKTGIAI